MKKLIAIVTLVCMVMAFAVGCDSVKDILKPAEKTFTKSGMSITLTEEFGEKEYVSYTAVYESPKVAVYTLKEETSLFGDANYTLEQYTKMVISANGLTVDAQNKDGLTYFEFDKELNGKNFHYFAFTYKGEDAFWLVQFACTKDQVSENQADIFGYAKTVKV